MNAAPAKQADALPPAWTLTFSSDLASSISFETRTEMSRWRRRPATDGRVVWRRFALRRAILLISRLVVAMVAPFPPSRSSIRR